MAHFDKGGRIFTYILTLGMNTHRPNPYNQGERGGKLNKRNKRNKITGVWEGLCGQKPADEIHRHLDGLFRFTETGKEFGIDLLSKHTMHSGVAIYIAWSGEFFVRRVKSPKEDPRAPGQRTHPPDEIEGGPPEEDPPEDPEDYELVIDNDSGTYRPNKDLLPLLKSFLEKNFVGLKVLTLACDDDELIKMKNEQREIKKAEGNGRTYVAYDGSSSISSSDEEELEARAAAQAEGGDEPKRKRRVQGHVKKGKKMLAEPKKRV
ncbi:hypothetical protein GP486_008278, partial [Trichoglossum hirsutum]